FRQGSFLRCRLMFGELASPDGKMPILKLLLKQAGFDLSAMPVVNFDEPTDSKCIVSIEG
ncbi:MAG TPA: hypothetical protein PLK99_05340, partial [Burkholderiales bacterium]|nr:hypothetical protein [Burkholderiales bacterium]